jgi:hypothetical protein
MSTRPDALFKLADTMAEDILRTPDEEVLREVAEDYGDPHALANKFDQILERAEKQVYAPPQVRSSFLDLSDLGSRLSEFLSSLRPRALAWSATAAAVVILAQAAVITAVLVKVQGGPSGQLATTEVPPAISAGIGKQGGPSGPSEPMAAQTAPEVGRIKPSQIAALVAAGRQLIVAGDIPTARLVLQQAADAGSAPAALALGGTYDPTIPQAQPASPTFKIGTAPDPVSDVAMARAWYEKARDLGSTEARVRLDRLTKHSSGGR